MPRTAARDRLVQTALELFYVDGFHAVGVDRIASEAGVGKMTLYRHFRSKEDLILAALRRRDEVFRAWFTRALDAAATTPSGKLVAVFDVVDAWIKGAGPGNQRFRGCAFVKASAEYGDPDDPIHAAAAAHKAIQLRQLIQLAREAGATAPEQLARQLAILREGAIAEAHVAGNVDAALDARRVAEGLVGAALPHQ